MQKISILSLFLHPQSPYTNRIEGHSIMQTLNNLSINACRFYFKFFTQHIDYCYIMKESYSLYNDIYLILISVLLQKLYEITHTQNYFLMIKPAASDKFFQYINYSLILYVLSYLFEVTELQTKIKYKLFYKLSIFSFSQQTQSIWMP